MSGQKLLTLDVATNTGWAVYELDRSESSIVAGCFHCDSKSGSDEAADQRFEMRRSFRDRLLAIFEEHQPDIACLESPLQYIKQHAGKPVPKKGDLFSSYQPPEAQNGKKEKKGGPNARTVLLLNQLYGAAESMCLERCAAVYEVDAQEWQKLTSGHAGKTTKDRSIEACRVLRIPITPNTKLARENAADAAMIAVWAKGFHQKQVLYERIRDDRRAVLPSTQTTSSPNHQMERAA